MRVRNRISVRGCLVATLVCCVALPALGKNKKEEPLRTCVASAAELTVIPLEDHVKRNIHHPFEGCYGEVGERGHSTHREPFCFRCQQTESDHCHQFGQSHG